jgi:uncharacterized protein (TIGR04551 family)
MRSFHLLPVLLLVAPAVARAEDAVPASSTATTAAPKGGDGAPSSESEAGKVVEPIAPALDVAGDRAFLGLLGADRQKSEDGVTYSEDWWTKSRPVFEVHGYLRQRTELFTNFTLGRVDAPGASPWLWAQPVDNSYTDVNGQDNAVALCGTVDSTGKYARCSRSSQVGANMRLRLEPELHISDNLRIRTQLDLFDNLVFGSTPDAYALASSNATSTSASGNRYAPIAIFSNTQTPPTAGMNALRNSLDVKRAWAEYASPVGLLRFGRMPFHWGLGMVYNAGDRFDSDWQTTVDRIAFSTAVAPLDLNVGLSYDVISSGAIGSSTSSLVGGQPTVTTPGTVVGQLAAFVVRRKPTQVTGLALARGEAVLNLGALATYRTQEIDYPVGTTPSASPTSSTTVANAGLERRDAWLVTPDVWMQFFWRKLRIEAEVAANLGAIGTPPNATVATPKLTVRQFGLVSETDFRAVDDKLRLGFGFGYASGDPWVQSLQPSNGWDTRLDGGSSPMSTFRFHPDYRVDLIFFRHLLTRVEGAYFFRPSVDYDFIRQANGQKLGGGLAVVWSRASEFVQAPGHDRDLGVELDLQLTYQAKDGTFNDRLERQGGFHATLQYGAFFPLGGLGYLPNDDSGNARPSTVSLGTSTAQTLRLLLGVSF